MQFRLVRDFLRLESASAILLLCATMIALVLANSGAAPYYQAFFTAPLKISLGDLYLEKPFLFWINDGLMALFFLLVGLELKREFLMGELASFSRVILPGVAALGGMLVPAIIYIVINLTQPHALKGWAIPVATDIAFALGVLSLFGRRIPLGVKLFLMALAIFDDVGAILIIAIGYSHHLFYIPLIAALIVVSALLTLHYLKIETLIAYLLLGFLLWLCVLNSGVHATIAGVVLAFFIPLKKLPALEKALHPWIAFLVMPLFALANAGVTLHDIHLETFLNKVTLGIILGLFFGKQLGVFSFTWICIKLGWARLPEKSDWLILYGVAILCGIGFTMSLFLGTLAFEHENANYLQAVRLGVLTGSTLSGIVGAMVLYYALRKGGRQVEAS